MNHDRSTPTRLHIGILAALAYAVVLSTTLAVTRHHVRPLYEGVGPSSPYRWVHPPPDFAAGNIKPGPIQSEVAIDNGGSQQSGVSSEDSQLLLNLPAGAVAPEPGATRLNVAVAPLDPAKLAAVPAGLRPDGNAYRIRLTIKPSERTLDRLAAPGNLVMTVPELGDVILYSADGKSWERLDTRPVSGPTTLGSTFSRAGYYLGAAKGAAAAKSSGSSKGGVVVVAVLTAALVLALSFSPAVFRRLRRTGDRRNVPARKSTTAVAGRRAAPTKAKKKRNSKGKGRR